MKIDLVYTWVNGADENWKRKKLQHSQQYKRPASEKAQSDARFMDNQELRYSIRSILTYASWINNIFIVTDDQVPAWLDSSYTKIKVVDHKEIFKNHDYLPTFNSMAIEANLHHVSNLSEYFIYSNDDMFLGDYCQPEYFFLKDGRPRIFVKDIIRKKKKWHLNPDLLKIEKRNEHQCSIINSRVLLKEFFKKSVHSEILHGMKACKRSDMVYLENIFNQQFLHTMSHQFRDIDDVWAYGLVSMYCLLNGAGKRTYVPSLSLKMQWLNNLIKRAMKPSFSYVNLSKADIDNRLSVIERNRPSMFCLNQFHDSPDANIVKVQSFLERYFPHPCPAEKAASEI